MHATIRVLVRGNRFAAAKVASARGIPFAFQFERRGDTYGLVPESFRDKAEAWFNEPATPHLAHGFPAGTCLHVESPNARDY